MGMGLLVITFVFVPVTSHSIESAQRESKSDCTKNCSKTCQAECKFKAIGRARDSCERECRKTCPDKCELGELQAQLNQSSKKAITPAKLQKAMDIEKAKLAAEKARLAEEEMPGLPEPGGEGTYVETPQKKAGGSSWWGRVIRSR